MLNRGCVLLLVTGGLAHAQTIPRLPDGHPNFQGVWRAANISAAFDVEAHEAGYQIPAGPSVIVDPPDGKLPYLPAAKLQRAKNWEQRYLDPVGYCHTHGVPRIMVPPFPMEIVQDGDTFAVLSETEHSMRLIPVSRTSRAAPHRKGYFSWAGDSRAHWEGDTLVVDVTGLNGRTWLDQAGNFVGPGAHVEERLTLTGPDRFTYEARVTEPGTFSLPWTMRLSMARQPKDTELIEYDCVEGERDIEHYNNLGKKDAARGTTTRSGITKAGGKR